LVQLTHGTVPNGSVEEALEAGAAHADWTIVIAPETNGRLELLAERVAAVGGRLLGPDTDSIRLAADKAAMAQHWHSLGVNTPATWIIDEAPSDRTLVVKPRDGAGSQAMGLGRLDDLDIEALRRQADRPLIAQEYISGVAASVAFLIGRDERRRLPACAQQLSADGRFRYLGGRVPLPPSLGERAAAIAAQAVAAVPGLFGYVGVDVVLGDDGRDWAIELNPRFTTSYVGLRALAAGNLMKTLLDLAEGRPSPPEAWKPGIITFTASGGIDYSPD
ncbi:MAG: ATP-grasp domain-containing protein, partial [Caldilineales bacterium]|nr:ATP-grasp domain-containing protein [Caldilineales bacterium]